MRKYQQFINNEWVDSTNKAFIEVINPANEAIEGYVSGGSEEDADKAIRSAHRAQKKWAKLPASKWPKQLLRIYQWSA